MTLLRRYHSTKLKQVERELDMALNALRVIATSTYPARYLGKRDDGTEIYGGSDDASRFAQTALDEIAFIARPSR